MISINTHLLFYVANMESEQALFLLIKCTKYTDTASKIHLFFLHAHLEKSTLNKCKEKPRGDCICCLIWSAHATYQ